jgi:hypothetical protein
LKWNPQNKLIFNKHVSKWARYYNHICIQRFDKLHNPKYPMANNIAHVNAIFISEFYVMWSGVFFFFEICEVGRLVTIQKKN